MMSSGAGRGDGRTFVNVWHRFKRDRIVATLPTSAATNVKNTIRVVLIDIRNRRSSPVIIAAPGGGGGGNGRVKDRDRRERLISTV